MNLKEALDSIEYMVNRTDRFAREAFAAGNDEKGFALVGEAVSMYKVAKSSAKEEREIEIIQRIRKVIKALEKDKDFIVEQQPYMDLIAEREAELNSILDKALGLYE